MRKSKVAKVEVWTRTTGSAEDVIVRLQANDGGAPKDVTSQESDIARRTLSSEFVEDAGYTAFLMPEHKLPEKNVWIIVESSGSTGQEVGVDGSGNLTYKALYEYPLDTLIPAGNSIDEYRQRDGTISNTTLTTREEVQDFARETINTLDEPERELSFPAESERAHELTPGEIIAAPLPDENLNGDVIVTEVRDTYEGVRLETDITAITVDTL